MKKLSENVIKIPSILFVFIASLCLTACVTTQNPALYLPQAPLSENFDPSVQKQLNAPSHWAVIANDLSEQLYANLHKNNLADKPVYVHLYSDKTEFSRAFNDFLTTSLVKKGVLVSRLKNGSTIYNYKIQTVRFNANRTTMLPNKFQWTSLAAGLIVVRNIADLVNVDGGLLTAGLLADAWTSESAPKIELIITSSILNQNIYIYRTSDVYYANSDDGHLYEYDKRDYQSNHVFDDPFYNKQ